VPALAEVAAIDVELDAVLHPLELSAISGFALSCEASLGRAIGLPVGGTLDAQRRVSWSLVSAPTHATSLAGEPPLSGRRYIDAMTDVTQVIEPEVVDPILDDGDHERFTHIVLEGYTPKGSDELIPVGNSVVEGMINQTAVRALCGKVWVPGRDPGKYPVCPTCIEVAESMGWKVPGR